MPNSNQYCAVATFYIGFFGSILISNIIRSIINVTLVGKAFKSGSIIKKLLISSEALETYENMQHILAVEKHMNNEDT